jgi:hypothetical protein
MTVPPLAIERTTFSPRKLALCLQVIGLIEMVNKQHGEGGASGPGQVCHSALLIQMIQF